MVRIFAVLSYFAFIVAFIYFVGFVAGVAVPKHVDSGPADSAVVVDLALVAFFGLVHSLMARAGWKRVWTRIVPPQAERSTYVLVASAQLALVCWQWRPLAGPTLWTTSGAATALVLALQGLGWAMALVSTCLIDHFELFGLRQAFGGQPSEPTLRSPFLYRWVRHPLYLGMLIGLWSAPIMTTSHLLLASLFTAYVLVGVRHEERDLMRTFGDAYRRYQAEVPMLLPIPRPCAVVARREPV